MMDNIREKLVEQLRELSDLTPPICEYQKPEEIELFGKKVTVYCKHFEQFQEVLRKAADYIANGVTGKNGPICRCPKCGGYSSIVWDPVTDTNTCTCGWTDSTTNVTVQEWIPVTERLPQEDGSYLVTTNYFGKHQGINIRCFAKDGETVNKYDLAGQKYVWYFYDSEYGYASTDSVTHWMPLPSLPKGE